MAVPDEDGRPSLAGHLATLLRRPPFGRPAWLEPSYRAALLLLAATPLLTALGAEGLAIAKEAGNRAAARDGRPRLAAHGRAIDLAAARARIAPLLTRPTASGMAERLAAILPPDAHVHALAVDDRGELAAEIDCADPDMLRAALAADPLGQRLRMIGQAPGAANGVRVLLGSAS